MMVSIIALLTPQRQCAFGSTTWVCFYFYGWVGVYWLYKCYCDCSAHYVYSCRILGLTHRLMISTLHLFYLNTSDHTKCVAHIPSHTHSRTYPSLFCAKKVFHHCTKFSSQLCCLLLHQRHKIMSVNRFHPSRPIIKKITSQATCWFLFYHW